MPPIVKYGVDRTDTVHIKKGTANLQQACDIMMDQIRANDHKRLTKRLGMLPDELIELVKENIQIVPDPE